MFPTHSSRLKNHSSESAVLLAQRIITLGLLALVVFSLGCQSAGIADLQIGRQTPAPTAPQKDPETVERKDASDEEPKMPILKEIVNYKRANPSASNQDLADRGNEILPKMGFEFDIDLGTLIEKAVESKKIERVKIDGDDDEYFYLTVPLLTESGKKTAVRVIASTSYSCCCGYYYTPIPVTQISPTRITVMIDGKPTRVKRSKDLPVVQEYILYEDEKSPKKVRSWEAPFETSPFALSADGRSVYFETDIKYLLLEVSSDGSLRFAPTDLPGLITQKEDLRMQPAPKVGEILDKSGDLGLYRYMIGGKAYVLEFPYVCT